MHARTLPLLTLAALALAAAPAAAAHRHDDASDRLQTRHLAHDDGLASDWAGDILVLKDAGDSHDRVELTPEGNLSINGEEVPLDRGRRRLVQDVYGRFLRIDEEAAAIGAEGAKLGLAGAALAARALAGAARLSRDDYDEEDLEREMAAEAARMERKGAELERWGETIEALVDDLRVGVAELRAGVPELRALDWFRVGDDREEPADD